MPTAARLRIRPFWPGHSRGFVVHRDNEMTVLLRRGGGRLEGWSAGCCWSPPAGGSKMAACGRKVSVTLPECLLLFHGLWWYTWRYRSVFSSSSTPLAVQGLVWIKERVHFHLNLTDRPGPSAFVRRSETDGEEIQKSIELGEGVILLLHVVGWNGIFLIRNAKQTQQ